MMKEQIIACIDGSNSTMAVSKWAAWTAERLNAPLKLLHVLEKNTSAIATDDWSGSIGIDSREELLAELVQLDQQRSKLAQEQGKHMLSLAKQLVMAHQPVATAIVPKISQRHGDLLDALTDLEQETRLIIMGKQGQLSTKSHSQVGSQLESVVRVMHTPILVVQADFKAPRRVMVAYDGSETSRNILSRLTLSPLLHGLECDLVMVGGAREQLFGAQTMLQAAGINVEIHILTGDVEAALKNHIEKRHIDLLIMGAYGHSRLRQFLVGSNTTRLLNHSSIPVLVLR